MSERSPIYVVSEGGESLTRMNPSAPQKEEDLQLLIAKYPDLICGEGEQLLLISREQGIADSLDGAARWSLDHLFVNRAGEPVLVEVKRASDTRLRREVVGQLLDYAANAVAYWPADTVSQTFENTCAKLELDPEVRLAEFLGPEAKVDEFWKGVEQNMLAGRLKLVFVADEIPAELARIVEFLNDQMDCTVSAVELRYFEGSNGETTLAPRVIGETERAKLKKEGSRAKLEPISIQDWITVNIEPKGDQVLAGARALIGIFSKFNTEHDVASTQGSIFSRVLTGEGKSAYPFFLTRHGRCQIAFGWTTRVKTLEPEENRRNWYNRFVDAVGPLSNENLGGFPSFTLDRLNDESCLNRFQAVAADFIAECRR